jgi:hypothetical protein
MHSLTAGTSAGPQPAWRLRRSHPQHRHQQVGILSLRWCTPFCFALTLLHLVHHLLFGALTSILVPWLAQPLHLCGSGLYTCTALNLLPITCSRAPWVCCSSHTSGGRDPWLTEHNAFLLSRILLWDGISSRLTPLPDMPCWCCSCLKLLTYCSSLWCPLDDPLQ